MDIPSGVAVPGWAYLDVKVSDLWLSKGSLAQAILQAPDNFDQSNAMDHASKSSV